jgi:hypothetical protein
MTDADREETEEDKEPTIEVRDSARREQEDHTAGEESAESGAWEEVTWRRRLAKPSANKREVPSGGASRRGRDSDATERGQNTEKKKRKEKQARQGKNREEGNTKKTPKKKK